MGHLCLLMEVNGGNMVLVIVFGDDDTGGTVSMRSKNWFMRPKNVGLNYQGFDVLSYGAVISVQKNVVFRTCLS